MRSVKLLVLVFLLLQNFKTVILASGEFRHTNLNSQGYNSNNLNCLALAAAAAAAAAVGTCDLRLTRF